MFKLFFSKENNFCGWINEIKGPGLQPKINWKLENGSSGFNSNTGPQFGKFKLIKFY